MPDVTPDLIDFPEGFGIRPDHWRRFKAELSPFPEDGADYMERLGRLVMWARERDYFITPQDIQENADGNGTPFYRSWVVDMDRPNADTFHFLRYRPQCHYCGVEHRSFGDCSCGHSTICQECGVGGCGLMYDSNYGGYVCALCMSTCEYCSEGRYIYESERCRECYANMVYCAWCDEFLSRDDTEQLAGHYTCISCYDNRCSSCEEAMADYGGLCDYCYEQRQDEALNYIEDFDYGIEDFSPLEFSFDRGRQRTSVEIEFAGDSDGVAYRLHEAGLSPTARTGEYHGGMGRENSQCAYVEYDGSISDGGEMIISRLMLPEQPEVRRLWQTLSVLRKRVRDGENSLNMQCGVHIHVDVSRYNVEWVMSSAVVYNFLERVLYHIASANWKSHRGASGNDYAKTTPKGIESSERFTEVFGYERYYGLNASNFLNAIRRCECGARNQGSQCTCRRYKATLEYRLWNTTVNPKKLHAYIALCQAITVFGRDKTLTAADLPAWEFDYRDKPLAEDASEYLRRLVWMFENLPLSAEERNSIRYCLRHCNLASILETATVGPDALDSSVVHGILHDDELLNIPEFIPPREDEDQLDNTPQQQPAAVIRMPFQDANGRWHDGQGRFIRDPFAVPMMAYVPVDASNFWSAVATAADGELIEF